MTIKIKERIQTVIKLVRCNNRESPCNGNVPDYGAATNSLVLRVSCFI